MHIYLSSYKLDNKALARHLNKSVKEVESLLDMSEELKELVLRYDRYYYIFRLEKRLAEISHN